MACPRAEARRDAGAQVSALAKSVRLQLKASGEPSAEQLTAIRAYTLRDFEPADIVVREFVLAHNGIDRDNEVFDEQLLADFARTLPGKGVFIRHPSGWDGDSGPPEGRAFGARVERMSFEAARTLLREPGLRFPPDRTEAQVLMASAYFVRTDENAALLTKMDAGIASDVSIGFGAKRSPDPIRDADGRELSARRWVSPGEALEMSIVWLGAQPGARAVKSAKPEEETMDPVQKAALEAAEQKAAAAEKRAADHAKAAEQIEGLRKALGSDADALLAEPAQLAAFVAAGKAHREQLVDAIVTAERHAGITADSDEAVKSARDLYSGFPVEKLQALAKRFERPGGSQIQPGDPAKGAPGSGGAKTPSDSPAANPAFA